MSCPRFGGLFYASVRERKLEELNITHQRTGTEKNERKDIDIVLEYAMTLSASNRERIHGNHRQLSHTSCGSIRAVAFPTGRCYGCQMTVDEENVSTSRHTRFTSRHGVCVKTGQNRSSA